MVNTDENSVATWALRFIPDRLTPLAFTDSWGKLRPEEQLRYNQLHGLYFHEQIIFFEQEMIIPMLRSLHAKVADRSLRQAVDLFIAEETSHSAGFHDLLRGLRPEWYGTTWQHFIRTGPLSGRIFGCMVARPRIFPLFLWLVQLLEERTMFASRLYLAEPDSFPLGVVAAQRQHLVDEADHVQWDMALLDQFWTSSAPWLRRANARLLNWIIGEFIAFPKRAALRVIDALAVDLPGLSVAPSQLKAELHGLSKRADFRRGIFGRDAVPRTWKLASQAPDLTGFVETWLNYERTV